jgi:hypothetical protein
MGRMPSDVVIFSVIGVTTIASLGWILNIIKIFDDASVVRFLGVFLVPVGSVLGFL